MSKRIVSAITTFFIGYLVATELFFAGNGILQVLSLLHLISLDKLYDGKGLMMFYGLSILVLLIASIIFVSKARKKHNSIYELFKPTWKKFFVNLVIFIVLLVISLILVKGRLTSINPQTFTLYNYLSNPLYTILGIIFSFLYLYPFSTLGYSLFQSFSKRSKKLNYNKPLLIVFLILLNPLIFCMGYINFNWYRYNQDIKSNNLDKCGARIIKPNEGSPAESAGIRPYEIVYKVDDIRIQSPNDLVNYLDNLIEQKQVKIETESKTYYVTPKKDPTSNKYRLGITVDQGYCKK